MFKLAVIIFKRAEWKKKKLRESIWYQHPSNYYICLISGTVWWSSIADEFLIASERSCERAVSGSRQRACAYGVWRPLIPTQSKRASCWGTVDRQHFPLLTTTCLLLTTVQVTRADFVNRKNRRFWSLSRSRDRHFVLAAIALLDCGKMATTGNSSRRKASKRPAAAATEPTTNGLVQPSDLVAPATKKSKSEASRSKAKKDNEGNIWSFYCFQLTF